MRTKRGNACVVYEHTITSDVYYLSVAYHPFVRCPIVLVTADNGFQGLRCRLIPVFHGVLLNSNHHRLPARSVTLYMYAVNNCVKSFVSNSRIFIGESLVPVFGDRTGTISAHTLSFKPQQDHERGCNVVFCSRAFLFIFIVL